MGKAGFLVINKTESVIYIESIYDPYIYYTLGISVSHGFVFAPHSVARDAYSMTCPPSVTRDPSVARDPIQDDKGW